MTTHMAVDLTAPLLLNLTLRAGKGGVLRFTITQNGAPLNLAGGTAKYYANLQIPIVKTLGAGITFTNPANGEGEISFTTADTSGQNVAQQQSHEFAVAVAGGEPLMVFEGLVTLEASLFVTALV
jgi:hypothetical protein